MKKAQMLVDYASSHSKKEIAWFAQRLFGVDAKYPEEAVDGGEGSGNFNHEGRPNQVGGSAPSGGGGGTGGGGGSSGGSSSESGGGFASKLVTPAPGGRKTKKVSREANKKSLDKANKKTAEACLEKAKQYPEGSSERKQYEDWADTMSKPLPGRPTPEDSQAMREKKLSNISGQLEPYAVERYKKDLDNEPKITGDLCDIADSIGTEMFGLTFRMKGAEDKIIDGKPVCRIAEKIAENQEEARRNGQDDSYEAATDRLSDLVRYTQACTPENLVDNVEATMNELEKRGYRPVKVKNTWETYDEGNPYRGVNCVFESPDGTRFELQFHTAESLVGKEVQHGWYEEYRTQGIDPERKVELGKRMFDNMASMEQPKGIGRIQNYPPNKTNESLRRDYEDLESRIKNKGELARAKSEKAKSAYEGAKSGQKVQFFSSKEGASVIASKNKDGSWDVLRRTDGNPVRSAKRYENSGDMSQDTKSDGANGVVPKFF